MSYKRRPEIRAKNCFRHLSPKYIVYFLGLFIAYWILISIFYGIIQDNKTVLDKIFHPSRLEIIHRFTSYTLALLAFHIGIAIEYRLENRSRKQTLANWREILINSEISEHMIFYDKTLTILWANGAASRSLGLTQTDIIGKKCYELWQNHAKPAP